MSVGSSVTKVSSFIFLSLSSLSLSARFVGQNEPKILCLHVIDSRNNIFICIQNSWLGLPEGMSSNTSEFQQALRYHLGALLTKLLALFLICPLTGLSLKAVWREREAMEAEARDKQVRNVTHYTTSSVYKFTNHINHL